MAVALFDLDRTLIDCNSGRLWMGEEWRAGNIGVRDVVWASWWLGRYSLGWEAGLDSVFEAAVAMLAGKREDELEERTRIWFERDVRRRLRPGAAEALERHRQAGDQLVLCTSSSVYAARAAMAAFGLSDEISSRFEVRDGLFTGKVASLALGDGKLHRTEEWAAREGIALQSCCFYTDSHADLALLKAVGRPVAVHPDRALLRQARALGWPELHWGKSP